MRLDEISHDLIFSIQDEDSLMKIRNIRTLPRCASAARIFAIDDKSWIIVLTATRAFGHKSFAISPFGSLQTGKTLVDVERLFNANNIYIYIYLRN